MENVIMGVHNFLDYYLSNGYRHGTAFWTIFNVVNGNADQIEFD